MATRVRVNKAGFTLLELLISVVILSMVIGLSTYSFSLFSGHWVSREYDQLKSQGDYQLFQLLDRSITACLPWIVRTSNGDTGFYFLGRAEGMTFVTAQPIVEVDAPAVVRIFREPDGPGRYKLVYEEASIAGLTLSDASQVLPFKNRIVIARNLSNLNFRFYGWSSSAARAEAMSAETGLVPGWQSTFDGLVGATHPDKLAIEIDEVTWTSDVPSTADLIIARMGIE
jgi:prepilin-type N-terminal cleavage/methylation domain-containing protein